jgi:DNA-directed RNA polymerase subunit beta
MPTKKTTKKTSVSAKTLQNIVPAVFQKCFQKDDRFFLNMPKNFEEYPDLLDLQKKGYKDFVEKYIHLLFENINPIRDIAWEKLYVSISDIKISEPQQDIEECKKKELTYWWVISWKIKLVEKIEEEWKKPTEKVLFSKRANVWTLPLMTPFASYVINGVERVIISQIIRSYGIFYNKKDFGFWFKLIPERGPWVETKIEKSGVIVVRVNKSRKFPITSLLRIFGAETDESIKELFMDCFDEEDNDFIDITLKKDPTTDALSAAEFIYNKLRPWELIDAENALDYIKNQFLNYDRINIWRIARRKINAKLWLKKSLDAPESNIFDGEDLVASIKYLVNLSNYKKWYYVDDSDHLSNKRVRTMWEILYAHLWPVMRKFVKSVKWKLSVLNMENTLKITDLVNFKIIDNSIKSFFATSQLSQFLDQINPLSELEHKRRITALWPGWLKRETAKFEVRDVHPSHYGRICPIETPEWQNIWLVTYQSLFSHINEEWFLETPGFKVFKEVIAKKDKLINRIADRDIFEIDSKWKPTKNIIVKEDNFIDAKSAEKIEKTYGKLKTNINVKPFVSDEVEYISPELDEKYFIADATTAVDQYNNITSKRVAARHFDEMVTLHVKDITHVDVNPSQIFSPNTSLIPFLDHNDSVRASMGTNQNRQWLPLLKNDVALVGTWLDNMVRQTHAVISADSDWEVVYVDGKRVKVKYRTWIKEYKLTNYKRSNAKTCIHQVPRVSLWQKVKKWDILAEWPCSEWWELAIWKNLKIAFMPWKWYNYEDAIIISQRLVKNDALTSIQIEEKEIEVSDTKLWPEETTNDIPWVSMYKLKNLDEDGIIRIWSIVKWWDILVWKITPKSEWELTPEEKLIQAIFWDKSKNVKDTSLYMPSWSEGKVIEVVILDAKKWDNLMAWVRKKVKVYVASTRKIEIWDKLAGKHWNKGIISIVVPEEDMPYSKEWEPIDVVLNPLWVISRMNLWQLFEVQLWYIAKKYWIKFWVWAFSNFWLEDFTKLIKELNIEDEIHAQLYDWQTWEPYDNKVTVGYMHLLKLVHMVEDKIHARSVWPYSLITQQPLWGKSRQWWQRFGEMEVWALEAYSAVYTLQEMLTVKSDDVIWRNKMYESIIKGQKPNIWWLPESFNLVTYLFKWLAQNIQPMSQDQLDEITQERINKIKELWLSSLTKESVVSDEEITENNVDESEEKEDIIDKVLEDMAESWDLDD